MHPHVTAESFLWSALVSSLLLSFSSRSSPHPLLPAPSALPLLSAPAERWDNTERKEEEEEMGGEKEVRDTGGRWFPTRGPQSQPFREFQESSST